MNNRYERDYWRDDGDQGRRGDDDERRFGSRDDHDRWPTRIEGRGERTRLEASRPEDRNDRWRDERYRDDRWSHPERRYDQERQYGSERNYGSSDRNYGQGQEYRYGQDYRVGQEHRYGQDYRSGDYRSNQYGNAYSQWGENRPHGQVPYAGSGEPRWGEPSRSSSQGEFGDYRRNWDRSQSSSTPFGSAYDTNRFGRGNSASSYGTDTGNYGSNYNQGGSSDWNRNRNWTENQGGGFFGRGPKGYTRSDDRIREDVCDRLSYDDELDASDITVTVQGGEVTLEGTVPDRRSKHRAEDISDNVHGVRDVHNKLKSRRGFVQEVGDRLMGREEEHEQGHSGSGTRNNPTSSSSSTSQSTGTQSYGSTTGSQASGTSGSAVQVNARNGR